ncbi:MAG: transporter related protein [Gammaproteobacteria bacterium]|jgi:ATP-binding cassette subfamily F protein uup|nr:transporter related protein [Gammaproteobacteria bacterium]
MTSLINARSITKSYGASDLFSGLTLNLFSEDRIGLIGPNGSGKSTLLKILAGLETSDEGEVNKDLGVRTVYLAQEDMFKPSETIKHALFGEAANEMHESDCERLIYEATGKQGVFPNLDQPVSALSGGWRKRLAIVNALLQKPDLLLIDEPTNHLDIDGILWLEDLLKNTSFAFVLVSHDRYFLENIASTMIELNKIYPDGYFRVAGNYSLFLEKKEALIESQLKKEQSLANQMRREREWLSRMPKARATKAQFRIDNAAQLEKDLNKVAQANKQTKKAEIAFDATHRKTKDLIVFHDVGISRGDRLLFEHLKLKLTPGKCLGLLGKNGSGKSTLMALLEGNISPTQGSIDRADKLRIVTFDQKREQLNRHQKLRDALSPAGDHVFFREKPVHVVAWAKRFLFTPERLQQYVGDLSGGEQARVLLANLMLQPADVLLLDEPTNDLDIPTLEVLEESLMDFPGALVLITHDRLLLDRLSDELLYLDGHGKAEFFADYAQWYQNIGSQNEAPPTPIKKTQEKSAASNLTYEERKELNRLPGKIENAEARILRLEQSLTDQDVAMHPDKLTEIYAKIALEKEKATQLYALWDKLAAKE